MYYVRYNRTYPHTHTHTQTHAHIYAYIKIKYSVAEGLLQGGDSGECYYLQ